MSQQIFTGIEIPGNGQITNEKAMSLQNADLKMKRYFSKLTLFLLCLPLLEIVRNHQDSTNLRYAEESCN